MMLLCLVLAAADVVNVALLSPAKTGNRDMLNGVLRVSGLDGVGAIGGNTVERYCVPFECHTVCLYNTPVVNICECLKDRKKKGCALALQNAQDVSNGMPPGSTFVGFQNTSKAHTPEQIIVSEEQHSPCVGNLNTFLKELDTEHPPVAGYTSGVQVVPFLSKLLPDCRHIAAQEARQNQLEKEIEGKERELRTRVKYLAARWDIQYKETCAQCLAMLIFGAVVFVVSVLVRTAVAISESELELNLDMPYIGWALRGLVNILSGLQDATGVQFFPVDETTSFFRKQRATPPSYTVTIDSCYIPPVTFTDVCKEANSLQTNLVHHLRATRSPTPVMQNVPYGWNPPPDIPMPEEDASTVAEDTQAAQANTSFESLASDMMEALTKGIKACNSMTKTFWKDGTEAQTETAMTGEDNRTSSGTSVCCSVVEDEGELQHTEGDPVESSSMSGVSATGTFKSNWSCSSASLVEPPAVPGSPVYAGAVGKYHKGEWRECCVLIEVEDEDALCTHGGEPRAEPHWSCCALIDRATDCPIRDPTWRDHLRKHIGHAASAVEEAADNAVSSIARKQRAIAGHSYLLCLALLGYLKVKLEALCIALYRPLEAMCQGARSKVKAMLGTGYAKLAKMAAVIGEQPAKLLRVVRAQLEQCKDVPKQMALWVGETFLSPPDPFKEYDLPDPNPNPSPSLSGRMKEAEDVSSSEECEGSFTAWEEPKGFENEFLFKSHRLMQERGGTAALLREVEDSLVEGVEDRNVLSEEFKLKQKERTQETPPRESVTMVNAGIQTPKKLMAEKKPVVSRGDSACREALYCSPRRRRPARKMAAKKSDRLMNWVAHQIWPFGGGQETARDTDSPTPSAATSDVSLETSRQSDILMYEKFSVQPKHQLSSSYSFMAPSPVLPTDVAIQHKRRKPRQRFNTLMAGGYTTPGAVPGSVVSLLEKRTEE
eukprot:TRINITY_DN33876_c0_g1_i1.p1 TRINITY_DN33876_c0_g1~~TRINITY_DN33876_c0_g1_i1.p1  ORF type:complete len:942 (+),score=228.63 TRINITY_DN33876_c0_g1_i1:40-2865(+)